MDKKIAKRFLFRVAEIMEEYDIAVFIADGTCLGAYREGDFIDWTHDIDISARAEELIPYLNILNEKFKKEGYDTRPLYFRKSVYHGWVLRFKGLILDIHGMYLFKGKRYRLGNRYTHAYPAEWFDDSGQIEFLGRSFYIPTPVEKYFECLYGKDYMTPKVIKPGAELEGYRAPYIFGKIEAKNVPRFEILNISNKLFIDVGVGKPNSEAWGREKEFTIIGFEPCTSRYNKLKDVYPGMLLNMAASDRNGETNCWESSEHGVIFFMGGDNLNKDFKSVRKKAIKLDSLEWREFDEIHLWADIEGAELLMLKGATKMLASQKVKWINLEIRKNAPTVGWTTAKEIYMFLDKYGFEADFPINKLREIRHRDVIFTPKEA